MTHEEFDALFELVEAIAYNLANAARPTASKWPARDLESEVAEARRVLVTAEPE